jgi:hypothetical protein
MIYSHIMIRNTISQFHAASPDDQDEILEFANDVVEHLLDEMGPIAAYRKLITELIPEIEDETGFYGNWLRSYRYVRAHMLQQVSC